jgi:hypothetical protein
MVNDTNNAGKRKFTRIAELYANVRPLVEKRVESLTLHDLSTALKTYDVEHRSDLIAEITRRIVFSLPLDKQFEDLRLNKNPEAWEAAKATIYDCDVNCDSDADASNFTEFKSSERAKGRRAKNPVDPVMAFAAGTTGVLSALQIKKMLADDATKTNAKKRNPDRPKIPRRRTFEKFQGRPAENVRTLPVSKLCPDRLDQLGDLIEIKLADGRVIRPNPQRFKLCAANGKLWIAGGRFARPDAKTQPNVLNKIAEIDHVIYGTRKDHLGDRGYTQYIHHLGEESGVRPTLTVDKEGFPVIRGGRYKIDSRGIVD